MTKKSHEWTKNQSESAKKPNYSKLYVSKPAYLDMIGDVKDKSIAELGCGNGYWLKILSDQGVKECYGVDNSKNQIKKAREDSNYEKINYEVEDATNKTSLEADYFDVVLIGHVILEMSNKEKIQDLFNEAYRISKKGGILAFKDIHPFSPYVGFPNIEKDKKHKYFDSGHIFKVVSNKPDGSQTKYKDFHWTVSDILNAITNSGFIIEKVLEPDPTNETVKKYPYLKYRKGHPLTFLVKARK